MKFTEQEMGSEETSLEEIKRYDRNQMSSEERKAFEEKIRTDNSFRNEAKAYATLKLALKEENAQNNKTSLTKKKQTRTIRLWTITAAAAALLLVYFILWDKPDTLNTDDLYTEYFSTSLSNTRGNGDEDHQWEIAVQQFNQGEYDQAIQEFKGILNDPVLKTSLENETHLYLSLIYLQQDLFEKGLKQLDSIKPESYLYQTEVKWWRLGFYLKMGDIELSRESVKDCLSDEHFFKREEAIAIQKVLES